MYHPQQHVETTDWKTVTKTKAVIFPIKISLKFILYTTSHVFIPKQSEECKIQMAQSPLLSDYLRPKSSLSVCSALVWEICTACKWTLMFKWSSISMKSVAAMPWSYRPRRSGLLRCYLQPFWHSHFPAVSF